jgi:hypothetical protein
MKPMGAPEDERVLDPISVRARGGEAGWWGEGLAVREITEPPGAAAPRHLHHMEDEGSRSWRATRPSTSAARRSPRRRATSSGREQYPPFHRAAGA